MQWKFFAPLSLLLGLLVSLPLGLLVPFGEESSVEAQAPNNDPVCPPADQALSGVWNPSRLGVNNPCQQASGTVVKIEQPEADGDMDLYISLDPQWKSLAGDPASIKNLHRWGPGEMLWEEMPRDAPGNTKNPSGLPAPALNDHVTVTGAWARDTLHGYNEIHPIWSISIDGKGSGTSGPSNGGTPATSAGQAYSTCRQSDGTTPCVGYYAP